MSNNDIKDVKKKTGNCLDALLGVHGSIPPPVGSQISTFGRSDSWQFPTIPMTRMDFLSPAYQIKKTHNDIIVYHN